MKPPRMILPNATAQSQKLHDEQISKVLSNISFGSSLSPLTPPAPGGSVRQTDPESNMDGDKLTVTSPVTPNTEFAVAHSLGRIPSGFIFLGGGNQGHVYRGLTAWTTTQIFLKETQGTNTFVILVI